MLCDICKANTATMHIVKVVNGVKQEFNICETCAKSSQGFGMPGDFKMQSPFTFQNVLSGLVDYINQSSNTSKSTEVVCSKCGMTYSDFKKLSLMGCSECYSNFGQLITPVIKRVQGDTEHVGKVPIRSGKEIMEKRQMETLKEQLQKAILSEEYEKAAELRDKIRELQSNNKEV